MLSAIGYARISKDDTLEGRGVGRQTEDITAVCARNGWQLVEVVTDNDISASRYSKKARPGFRRLLERIADGVDRAVVYDVDRLLRQPRELEDLIDLCERRNGAFQLHTINGELDLTTGSGRFVARMLAGKAAMESDDLSRRLRRSFDQKAREGRPHGARAFGYEADGMTVRESEAELFRQAAADVLDGVSLNQIAHRWNALGVFTPQRSREWNGTVVKAVLTGPRHAGLRVHRGEVIGPAAWPAIIDRATHDRLVARLNRRGPRTPPRRRAFTGLVTDVHGVPLVRDSVKGRPTYRGQKRVPGRRDAEYVTISAEPLEALVLEMLFASIEDGDLGHRVGAIRRRREAAPDMAAMEDDLRGLADDFGNGRISRAEWMAARQPLEDRLHAARAAVERAEAGSALDDIDVHLRTAWPDLDVDRQRAILGLVFDSIRIGPAARRGPAPMVEGIGRIDLDRVNVVWRA